MSTMIKVSIEIGGNTTFLEVEKDSKTHKQLMKQIDDAHEAEFAAFRSSAQVKLYAAVGAVFEEFTDEEKNAMVGRATVLKFNALRVSKKETVQANRVRIMTQGTRGDRVDDSMADDPIEESTEEIPEAVEETPADKKS